MALSANGSRPITVDGVSYRWAVSPDSGYDVLVVQSAEGVGAKLRITISWSSAEAKPADGKETFADDQTSAITPGLVTTIIRQARDHDWLPDQSGPDFVGRLNRDGSNGLA